MEKSDILNDSENYPKYYVNTCLFSVVKQTSLYQFERIIYDNQKNDLRKFVGFTKNRVKDSLQVIDFLVGYKPCDEKVYEAVRIKAIALFDEYIKKDGYSYTPAGTAKTDDTAGNTAKNDGTAVNENQNSANQ